MQEDMYRIQNIFLKHVLHTDIQVHTQMHLPYTSQTLLSSDNIPAAASGEHEITLHARKSLKINIQTVYNS